MVDVMTRGLDVLRPPSSPVALAFWCLVVLAAFLWFMRHVMPVLERLVRWLRGRFGVMVTGRGRPSDNPH